MNDPGVDAPVHKLAEDLEKDPYKPGEEHEEEAEQDFLDPMLTAYSRWWFASTACPLIAGTFGPMANAFSICALVEPWRASIPEGSSENHGEPVKDPGWVIAINALSLFFSLAANLALLLKMARRLPFAIAHTITIGGWLLSSALLIALVVAGNSPALRLYPREKYTLTQAYYYAIFAAVLYCVVSFLLVITVYGTYKGHYGREFRLTVSQRTLMLQTIMLLMYLLLGACVFKFVEGWKYLDALYWADVTLLTVGLGSDFSPKTHLGRSLLFPFAICGIVSVGLVIGSIRALVLDRGKNKMEARLMEKKREEALRSIKHDKGTIKIGWFHTHTFPQHNLSEIRRREQEFLAMRKIQDYAMQKRRWYALTWSGIAAMSLWLVGAAIFWVTEQKQGWSYFQALYFAYTSLLTIGYGDLYPMSNSGKPMFVFWSLLAVPTLTVLISNMGETVIKAFENFIIWAGSLTILPDESGFRSRFKATLHGFSKNAATDGDIEVQKPPGFMANASKSTEDESHDSVHQHALDRLAGLVEIDELIGAQEASDRGDTLERDIHLYHYVLAREQRTLAKDIHARPPKKYSYSEWAWFLKLIGQDEAKPDLHRTAPGEVHNDSTQKRSEYLGQADGDEESKNLKWSWLGTRSPLMGRKNEAEWLLERMGMTLEKELRKMSSDDQKVRKEKPPISIADLRRPSSQKGRKGSDDKASQREKQH
ncbi:voltage-gated potassium channel [Trichodelitschia bisporula]|uniref:Voltage-gated potassium channel n=1 Tax=Trichodelitschia bisporula TaxID=703511 RepID=A0A6G1HNR9_9PEZI|nr:voltage-gated potassium channel [Trichodelitschia bisporula]